MGLNDHEAGGSSARGAKIRRAAPRPQSLNPDEATILAEARLLVPPYWHLPAGWRVSAAGYAIPPVPEKDEDLRGYIRRRRAALTPWDRANPDWGEDSALWRPRFEMERLDELANQYGMYAGGRYNQLGRQSFWAGKDVDTVLAALGYVPLPRGAPRRLPPPYGEPRAPPALPPRRHEGIVLPPPATSEPRDQISIRGPAPHLRVPKPEPQPDPEPEPQPRWTAYLHYQSEIRAPDDPADTPGLTQALQQSKAEVEDDKWWSSDDDEDVILGDVELSYQAQMRAHDDPADTPGLTQALQQSKALQESKVEEEGGKWWSSDEED
ncbi:hypothetical protein QYE76_009682 [Lolium multiflorum]|uniref:Uncharacterized protein n=1 Tax=Lolium multiflorum TaxID=4521 RepID=A0AAD8RA52_LOLMU|nr:hypothetical protein QYE76_028539 [Lolium multiflorum]KAK1616254.1 hypothetical protein QYE76_021771 [Lolium multiflorum]KAK1647549.1 hypothetical protein QYE76_065354 [Lolium multiflorum]KAK1692985.1 hypothetical protein QYE76_009682 [Lolium multiflorum]